MGWFRNPFARKPSPRPTADWTPPPASDDWQIGNQAECLVAGPWFRMSHGIMPPGWGPQLSEVRVVTAVHEWSQPNSGTMVLLVFARWPGESFFAGDFRKITPRADAATRGAFTSLDELLRAPAPPELVELLEETE